MHRAGIKKIHVNSLTLHVVEDGKKKILSVIKKIVRENSDDNVNVL